ncbi:MAG: DNA topoisomerase III, partial [Limisphaerales bacterium]
MGKALIIAEKPSVASDISKALGGFKKQDDYFESDEYVISSAVGHLLELIAPEGFEVKRGKWTFAALPVIPPHFDLRPIEKNEARLKVLSRLIKRKDIDSLINACDAGREGELIFRYIVQHTGTEKPIKRLWLQSMTPQAIKDGFSHLRDDQAMRPLADAAVCRSESDWLVGINGTRAMTAFNSKSGGFHKTTVGRVQTPTLAIVVEREEKIRKFVSRDYWEVHGTFGAAAGEYVGRWFDEGFSRQKDGDTDLKAERLWDLAKAEAIRSKCTGKPGIVTEESKPTTQLSPLLFDLTSLQREANSRFGYPAKRTLGIAQALYEKHKVLTYPRTDSKALPEDYIQTVHDTLGMLRGTQFGQFANEISKQGWVKPNKRIFNNAKVSDHFAIIPTTLAPKNLDGDEAKIYDFVTRRFLAVFYPAAEFQVTTRITRVENEPFKSEGKIMMNAGWLEVYGKDAETDDTPALVAVAAGETPHVDEVTVAALQTKPPARYSEATLLSAMEGAGKLVEDGDMRAAMEAKGLGTPATRAATIEGLIREQYVHREGRELVPTPKAFSLMFAFHMLHIVELGSPELTGEWEHKLKLIEAGKLTREEFMRGINDLVKNVVGVIKNGEIPDVAYATVPAPCPKCGGTVQENYRKVVCQKCDFTLWRVISGREWAPEELAELFTKRLVGTLTGFLSKQVRPFAAGIRLNDELRLEFDFGQGTDDEAPPDFSGQEPLGKCPKCDSRVFEHGVAYVCERAIGTGRTCDFRSGRLILQQPIERAQMEKLLATG